MSAIINPGTGGGGGGGTCANSPQLLCLGGRTGSTNNPTISSDAEGTITGSGATGQRLSLTSNPIDVATPGVHVEPDAFGEDRLLVGPGPDPTSALAPGGILTFLISSNSDNGALFGAAAANNADGAPTFLGVRSGGTLVSPTETLPGKVALQFLALGYDNTNAFIINPPMAVLSMSAGDVVGTGFVSGRITFSVCDNTGSFLDAFSASPRGHLISKSISGVESASGVLTIGEAVQLQVEANTIGPTNLFTTPVAPYWPQLLSFNQNLTLDASAQPVILSLFQCGGVANLSGNAMWDVSGPNGFYAFFGLHVGQTIRSEVGGNQRIVGLHAILENGANVHARGPACTAGDIDVGIITAFSDMTYTADLGADLTVHQSRGGIHSIGIAADGTVVIDNNIGWEHRPATILSGSPTITDDTAFYANDTGGFPIAGMWSLYSDGASRTLAHLGAGVFGANAAASNASVGLEVQSTTRAFLVSRMTTTQKNALTPLDGMIVYDTTLGKFQGREAGAWTNLI